MQCLYYLYGVDVLIVCYVIPSQSYNQHILLLLLYRVHWNMKWTVCFGYRCLTCAFVLLICFFKWWMVYLDLSDFNKHISIKFSMLPSYFTPTCHTSTNLFIMYITLPNTWGLTQSSKSNTHIDNKSIWLQFLHMDKWQTLCILGVSKQILQVSRCEVYIFHLDQGGRVTLWPKQWTKAGLPPRWEAIFSLFLWLWVPFLIVDEFVYFYLGVGNRLFIRLQGQLDVAWPLGLLLGVDLQGHGSKGQQNGGGKGHLTIIKKTFRSGGHFVKEQSQYYLFQLQTNKTQLCMCSTIKHD